MERAIGTAAACAGLLVRFLFHLAGVLVRASGPALIFVGVRQISPPAGYIVAGAMITGLLFWPRKAAK